MKMYSFTRDVPKEIYLILKSSFLFILRIFLPKTHPIYQKKQPRSASEVTDFSVVNPGRRAAASKPLYDLSVTAPRDDD